MKICIVCPRLCHGGAERVAVSLANGFVRRGHEVLFFADLYEEQTYELDSVVHLKNLVPQTNSKLKKWSGAIKKLRKQLKYDKPNAIIGIMPLCSIVAKLASIGTRIPVIATEHNSYERPESAPMPFMSRLYKYLVCKFFKKVTVLTKADKKIIGNRLRNVVVMENPLALEPIEDIHPRKKVILASGRVDNWHYKGFDVLIRAWGHINGNWRMENGECIEHDSKHETSIFSTSSNPFADWKLVIAGVWRNPETRKYLDGIADECGVKDKIEYLGFVEDMQSLYQESSIFVLSSRYEGFGLVLIEAMSQGCACVACDYKGRQREILNPTQDQPYDTRNLKPETRNLPVEACETGILCEPDDVDALADAMAKMIIDDEYRESVRKNAIERSNYYSIENTMDRWESLLMQVTGTNNYDINVLPQDACIAKSKQALETIN